MVLRQLGLRNVNLPNELRDKVEKDRLSLSPRLRGAKLDEWIDTLTPEQYRKITNWFSKLPKLEHVINYKNPKSGKDFTLRLQGVKDFF